MAISLFKNNPFFTSLLSTFPEEFSVLAQHKPLQDYVRETHSIANTSVDIKETPEAFIFAADMPGIKREEVKVQIEGHVLTISGERTKEVKEEKERLHRVERSTAKFLRQFQLPKNVDLEKISATSVDGVLTVTVPKLAPPESEKPKTIKVTVGEAA